MREPVWAPMPTERARRESAGATRDDRKSLDRVAPPCRSERRDALRWIA
jgi:hypothetical protein